MANQLSVAQSHLNISYRLIITRHWAVSRPVKIITPYYDGQQENLNLCQPCLRRSESVTLWLLPTRTALTKSKTTYLSRAEEKRDDNFEWCIVLVVFRHSVAVAKTATIQQNVEWREWFVNCRACTETRCHRRHSNRWSFVRLAQSRANFLLFKKISCSWTITVIALSPYDGVEVEGGYWVDDKLLFRLTEMLI